MKLVTSLLLGSAASLAAVAGAQAADLPFRKAAPVDYVRVCDWVGEAGYFYIPGTDTCIKIGGMVRAEYAWVSSKTAFFPGNTGAAPFGTFYSNKAKNESGYFARGKIEVDTRTQTAYGLLRANVRLQSTISGGVENGPYTTGDASSTILDRGYITFAGFTAGRVQSLFDFYADNYNYEGIANSDESTQVLAYTASFGGGFSATVSVEDPNGGRRDGILNTTNANGLTSTIYGGTKIPDIVGVLRYEASWGAAQLSGAYHEVNTINGAAAGGVIVAGVPGAASNDKNGFAVQAGVDIKLPMIAAGDELFLQGAYQEGAYLYQDSGANLNAGFFGNIIGGFQHPDGDAVALANAAGGYSLSLGKGFSVMGAFHHYFTPQFHDVLYGSYEEISYGAAKNIDWTLGGVGDANEFRVGNQFIFTPVHNLDIGVDVMYAKISQDLGRGFGSPVVGGVAVPTALPAGIKKDPDSFQVRLRMERDF